MYQIHALIYKYLPDDEAEWLHNSGYKYEKRSFKLFTFSSILEHGQYNPKSETFKFPASISFYIASPATWILRDFSANLIKTQNLQLGNNELYVNAVEVYKEKTPKTNEIKVKALTPIEVHSSLKKANGKHKTYYYHPHEDEFAEMVDANIRKKWESFYKEPCPHKLEITSLKNRYLKERVRFIKNIVIKGWVGDFILKSHPKLLQFALYAGLGSRNSVGFGMIEPHK